MTPRRTHRAFTLIELLLVVAILSAATALSIGAAGPMSAGQQRRGASAAGTESIERTRLLAIRGGGATLSMGETLVARPDQEAVGLASIERSLPRQWVATINDDDEETLRFGADGVCDDVRIVVRGPNNATATVVVLGVTGQVVERAGVETNP